MLQTYIHGGECIAIQCDAETLVCNPSSENAQQAERLIQHPHQHIIHFSLWSIPQPLAFGPFSVVFYVSDDLTTLVAHISVKNTHIFYHLWSHQLSMSLPVVSVNLLLVDLRLWLSSACAVVARIHATTVVPLSIHSQDDPIAFCREIMLHNWWIPKFLKNGQYVVHAV